MIKEKPLCHECVHCGEILGSHHCSCYGVLKREVLHSTHATTIATLAMARKQPLKDTLAIAAFAGVKINLHGWEKGWANWPWNFDPIWIEECPYFKRASAGKPSEGNSD